MESISLSRCENSNKESLSMGNPNRFCTKCGAPVDIDDLFCARCGSKLKVLEQNASTSTASPESSPPPTSTTNFTTPPPSPKSSAPITPPTPPISETPKTQTEKPKSKAKGILITILIVALGWGAGKLIGGELGKSYKPSTTSTKSPIVTVAPIAEITKTPLDTEAPVQTSLTAKETMPPVDIEVPDVSELFANINKGDTPWNYLKASDDEIRDVMTYFWCGTDKSTGAKCAFFSDKDAKHGGYYWWKRSKDRFQANFVVGTFINPGANSDILLDEEGNETPVKVISRKDGSIDFNFGSGEYIKGSLRLKKDEKSKDEVLKLILNYKHTLEKMGN
jgi:hypothetical protein